MAALVASAAEEQFTDVVYLQVTEGTSGHQLPVEVALTLGCPPSGDLAESLAGLASDRRVLVVLDNLEALAEGPDVVRRLLQASAALTVLVTSRLPLRVDGEHVMPVDPLEVPGTAAAAATIAASASVQLFVDRARSADPGFRLVGQEHDVAQVCFLLDGLPLALELAAARVKLRSLDRIIDGLRDSLELLSSGSDDGPHGPERQRTMTSVIRWSYDRLTPAARLVCDRLALFERGFTIESVEAVCPDVPGVVEAIASIVDARLVRSMESRAEVRFVVLGTVRAFARERLLTHIDLSRSHELLAAHLTARVEAFATQLYGPDSTLTLARFDDDAADIEASRRLGARGRATPGRRTAAAGLPWTPGSRPAATTRRSAGSCGCSTTCRNRARTPPGCWLPPRCWPISSATTTGRRSTAGWPWSSRKGTATGAPRHGSHLPRRDPHLLRRDRRGGRARGSRLGGRRGPRPLPAVGPGAVRARHGPGLPGRRRRRTPGPREVPVRRPRQG